MFPILLHNESHHICRLKNLDDNYWDEIPSKFSRKYIEKQLYKKTNSMCFIFRGNAITYNLISSTPRRNHFQ